MRCSCYIAEVEQHRVWPIIEETGYSGPLHKPIVACSRELFVVLARNKAGNYFLSVEYILRKG